MAVNPENVYLVTNPGNIREVTAYVIFSEFTEGTPQDPKRYVKFTIHEKGSITHWVYLIKGDKLDARQNLANFPAFRDMPGVDVEGKQTTGVDDCLIVKVDNSLSSERAYGRSDYTPSVHTLIEALDMAFARRAEVLAKFSRPVPQVPEGAMQFNHALQKWVFKTEEAIILKEGQQSASYLTWQANLADVEVEVQGLMEQLLIKLKLSKVLLAGENTGANSGVALRLLLIPTLSKVRKFSSALKAAVSKVLSLKSKLDVALGLPDSQAFEPDEVTITLQDGIPNIPIEDAQLRLVNAQTISTLTNSKILDGKAALRAALAMGILEEDMLAISQDPNLESNIQQITQDAQSGVL